MVKVTVKKFLKNFKKVLYKCNKPCYNKYMVKGYGVHPSSLIHQCWFVQLNKKILT